MNFNQLVAEICAAFEKDAVDSNQIKTLLNGYTSKREEWNKYAIFDEKQCTYTRNLVHRGNGKFNLLILCWGPNACTNVHDHPGASCFVKVLKGDLMETKFNFPEDGADRRLAPLVKIDEETCKENEVTFIDDSMGVHRMENPSHSEPAVSLHLYCPPYAECSMFDQRTSKKHIGKISFWSEYGTVSKDRCNSNA
ncbi:hypothetical protein PFISCL1PPCAC_21721, partial [Pristionchus fissidentatus]